MTTVGKRDTVMPNANLQFFLVLLIAFSTFAFADGNNRIIKKIPIPGQGGWDYLIVDEGARRLYVSHGTQVEVLDVDSGAIVGKIPNTLSIHGIALEPELGRGFVSDGRISTVTIFNFMTLETVCQV